MASRGARSRGNELFAFYRAIEHFQSSYLHTARENTHTSSTSSTSSFSRSISSIDAIERPNLAKLQGKAKLGQTARESQTWPNTYFKSHTHIHEVPDRAA